MNRNLLISCCIGYCVIKNCIFEYCPIHLLIIIDCTVRYYLDAGTVLPPHHESKF